MSIHDRALRRQPLIVDVEASSAYEFLMTLRAISEVEHHAEYEVGKEWFDDVRKKASPDLLALIEQFSFHSYEIWEHMLGLVYDCPAPRDVPTFIAHIEAIDPLEIRLHMLGYYVREHCRVTPPEIILQAAQGDIEAQRKLLKTSFPDDTGWQRTLRWLLSLEQVAPGFNVPEWQARTSRAMTELCERARAFVLEFFHASPDEYTVVFTSNASNALKLVGEAYPFKPGGHFLLYPSAPARLFCII